MVLGANHRIKALLIHVQHQNLIDLSIHITLQIMNISGLESGQQQLTLGIKGGMAVLFSSDSQSKP